MNESDYRKDLNYVDVRGVHPMVVCGQVGVRLEGKPRTISVADGIAVADVLLAERITLRTA
jgi:hypothetical protein